MRFLVLRFDSPLMSFGGIVVDANGVTGDHPTLSQLTGLLGNALGFAHADSAALQRLQERITYGARRDLEGRTLVDYQTVDLGQPGLAAGGWTTWGVPEARGGAFSEGTHQRYRHYVANAVYTVALTLMPTDEAPTLADVAAALREPERPLFLGRKACIPSGPILVGDTEAASALDALKAAAPSPRTDALPLDGWVSGDGETEDDALVPVADRRDWHNQVHTGRRWVRRVRIGGASGA